MADYRIAVLDIGKTNKKLFVYDSRLKCLNPDEKGAVIGEVTKDGILCDDMEAIRRWMMAGLAAANERHGPIGCISVSAHGATIALLGRGKDEQFAGDGGLAFPIVSYMQEISKEDEEGFFELADWAPSGLKLVTGTANFGRLLNHGKQVYWLKKHFPAQFEKVTDILMFAQYIGYLLTGKKAIEPTYIGCHGFLLRVDGTGYSDVAEKLGVADKLPPLPFVPSWHTLGTLRPEIAESTGLSKETIVTVGAHDSNAALVPLYALGSGNFILQDGGTWVVTMTAAREARIRLEEMERETFLNWNVYGGPLMTSIFRGGAEYDYYRTKVFKDFTHPDGVKVQVLREVIGKREAFILPTVERGSGFWPESPATIHGANKVFDDAATAWGVFDVCLAIQGYAGINLTTHKKRRIIIQGNIAQHNPIYCGIISALYADREVVSGSTGGAAYGAAILGACAVERGKPEDFGSRVQLDLRPVAQLDVDKGELDKYVEQFFYLVNRPPAEPERRRRRR